MNYTLKELITALQNKTITTDGGDLAELTRTSYFNQYASYINTGQYIPIFYFNVLNNSVFMNNTSTLSFIESDLFTADDWTILNQTIYPFNATLVTDSPIISNVSITLSVGDFVNGYGIPENTTVVSVGSGTYTLSSNATINSTTADLYMTKAYSTGK